MKCLHFPRFSTQFIFFFFILWFSCLCLGIVHFVCHELLHELVNSSTYYVFWGFSFILHLILIFLCFNPLSCHVFWEFCLVFACLFSIQQFASLITPHISPQLCITMPNFQPLCRWNFINTSLHLIHTRKIHWKNNSK